MEQPKTVLIVEDEKNIVDILRFNLQREGYQTAEAYDGEEGLEKARTADPDLILLDVMLPKMNGFDVCRQLRQRMRTGSALHGRRQPEYLQKIQHPQGLSRYNTTINIQYWEGTPWAVIFWW